MDEADIVCPGLENLGLLWNGCRGSIVEPVEEQVRVSDHDQGLDDHRLEKFFDKPFLDLKEVVQG
jgi:hypothetical protein